MKYLIIILIAFLSLASAQAQTDPRIYEGLFASPEVDHLAGIRKSLDLHDLRQRREVIRDVGLPKQEIEITHKGGYLPAPSTGSAFSDSVFDALKQLEAKPEGKTSPFNNSFMPGVD